MEQWGPLIRSSSLPPMAKEYHNRIEAQISDFAEGLADDEIVAAEVILNDGRTMRATWFGYHNPYMIIVDGLDAKGRAVRALVPMQNIQIILMKVKKGQQRKSRTIGFQPRNDAADET